MVSLILSQWSFYCNRFFNFGSRKKTMLTPSPKPKRRGSNNSGEVEAEGVIGSAAHHSYSTGNLQELDDKTVVMRSVYLGLKSYSATINCL